MLKISNSAQKLETSALAMLAAFCISGHSGHNCQNLLVGHCAAQRRKAQLWKFGCILPINSVELFNTRSPPIGRKLKFCRQIGCLFLLHNFENLVGFFLPINKRSGSALIRLGPSPLTGLKIERKN